MDDKTSSELEKALTDPRAKWAQSPYALIILLVAGGHLSDFVYTRREAQLELEYLKNNAAADREERRHEKEELANALRDLGNRMARVEEQLRQTKGVVNRLRAETIAEKEESLSLSFSKYLKQKGG